jgi:hypothetical protein
MILFAQEAVPPEVGAGGILAGGLCVIVSLLLGLVGLVIWIWALIDAIKNPGLSSNERLIWILVIIFTSWIGALIYFLIGRKK